MTNLQNEILLRSAIIIADRHLRCNSETAKTASKRALQTLCNGNMLMFASAMSIAQSKYKL